MQFRLPTIGLLAAAALGSGLSWAAQKVYRANVEAVLVEMRVLQGGDQVTDLRRDEVALLVDGAPRPILSMTYQASPPAQAGGAGPAQGPRAAADVSARRIALVVHRTSIAPGEGPRVLDAARDFIERLPPDYALAVVAVPLAGGTPSRRGIPFETDRRHSIHALADALKHTSRIGMGMEGMAGFGCTGAAASEGCGDRDDRESPLLPRDRPRASRTMRSAESQAQEAAVLGDLQGLFGALGGGPSDVVLISGGLPQDESMRPLVERTIDAARVSGVHVHTLIVADLTDVPLPEGVPAAPPRRTVDPLTLASAAAYGLAAETGGIDSSQAATGTRFFGELSRQVAGSYLLSFEPLPAERDGRPHRIEIRVSRHPAPAIYARRVFVIPPAPPETASRPAEEPSTPASPATPAPLPVEPAAAGAGSSEAALRDSSRRTLIGRASAYVQHFQQAFSTVVVEERYVQVVKLWNGVPPTPGDEPELAWKQGRGEQLTSRARGPVHRRQILSDVLLVQAPEEAWIGYRDVAAVDGRAVRDRPTRVQELFMSGRPADRSQLERIARESSRYNLGTGRNFNTPTFPLQVLLASPLSRFKWTDEGADTVGSSRCTVLGFSEVDRPTLVRTPDGRDIPMTGRFWIEPGTGRVARALLRFSNRTERIDGAFDVTYGPQAGMDVLAPGHLWEWYSTADPELAVGTRAYAIGSRAYVEGEATYGNIRRFTVKTDESIR